MKKLYTLLCICCFISPLSAQHLTNISPEVHGVPSLPHNAESTVTAGRGLDTLDQYLKRSTGLITYTITYTDTSTHQTYPVPLTGANGSLSLYIFVGANYDFSGTALVKGFLVSYAAKQINGNPDSLGAYVYLVDQNGIPSGNPVGGTVFTADKIDTSSSTPVFTSIMFPSPVNITSKFSLIVQTAGVSFSGDIPDVNFMYSNQQGDGKGEKRAVVVYVNGNNLVPALLSDYLGAAYGININGQPLDIDPMILPILDITSDVKDYPSIHGLTLKGAYPNPAADKTSITIELAQPSDVEVSILDMSGRILQTLKQEKLDAGAHSLEINVGDIPSGKYLYTVKTKSAHFGGSLTIVK